MVAAAEIDPSKGYACVKCSRVYDGIKSWLDGNRDENTQLALKRHTRAELDAAGLTDVQTLEEEMQSETPKAAKPKAAKDKSKDEAKD